MAVQTKTETRRQTIKAGSSRGATLGQRAAASVALDEIRGATRRAIVEPSTGQQMAAQAELAASMAADSYSPPDATSATAVIEVRTLKDPRRVPIAFLLSDLRRAVKLWTRGYGKAEREDIATDALLLLAQWTRQGAIAPMYLGQRGALPLRRDWYDADARTVIRDGKATRPAPNEPARRAMRAAILQAQRKRSADTESALASAAPESVDIESIGAAQSLAQLALDDFNASAEIAPRLPDTDAPELLADALGVTLTAARAAIAQAWRMSNTDCAREWKVSDKRAENIRSAGSAELRKRWPMSRDLLAALAAAGAAIRERMRTRAWLAITAARDALPWQDADALRAAAALAVNEYRAAVGELPAEERALELAARRVGWMPDYIAPADHIRRLLTAERTRAQRSASAAARGSHLAARRA